MNYAPIEGLPEQQEIDRISSPELEEDARVWKDKEGELQDSGVYLDFSKKLQREWAIETGIIERLYNWDRGITETLIEQGIDALLIIDNGGLNRDEAENASKMIKDQQSIVDGLFQFVKGEQPLSEHYIRSMHSQFTKHQDYTEARGSDGKMRKIALLKGQYKKLPNNPTRPDGTLHKYCPPELVVDEMARLLNIYENNKDAPPEVLSAWLHHRFTQIHPFQDGNGRMARSLASLVFLKRGLFPLVIRSQDKQDYIQALEKADAGDIAPLVKIFAKRQHDSIKAALEIQHQAEQSKHVKQIIASIGEKVKRKVRVETKEKQRVYSIARELHTCIESRLEKVSQDLQGEFDHVVSGDESYHVDVKSKGDGSPESHYFYKQIIETARKQDYFANRDDYKSWVRLAIHSIKTFVVVFSIHTRGNSDKGIMVVSGFTFERIPSDDDSKTQTTQSKECHPDIFQFNYREEPASIKDRFDTWIEEAISIALVEYSRTIS